MSAQGKTKNNHTGMGPNGLRCTHCGSKQAVAFPCDIEVLSAICLAFEAKHKGCPAPEQAAATDAVTWKDPRDWKMSDDTGISSETIWSVLAPGHARTTGYPLDPSDLGRCVRLLRAFDWTRRLGEVVPVYPEWEPFVRAWPELEKLYDEELPSGRAPKCYARMQECRKLAEEIVRNAAGR